jgi:hypothetical protein
MESFKDARLLCPSWLLLEDGLVASRYQKPSNYRCLEDKPCGMTQISAFRGAAGQETPLLHKRKLSAATYPESRRGHWGQGFFTVVCRSIETQTRFRGGRCLVRLQSPEVSHMIAEPDIPARQTTDDVLGRKGLG